MEKKKPAKKGAKKNTKKKGKKEGKKDKKVKAPKKKQQDGGDDEKEIGKGRRFFKLIYNGEKMGRFSGNKPKQAANKALTSIIHDRQEKDEPTDIDIKFKIVECTRRSKQKKYYYVGSRVELPKPVEVKIKNPTDGSFKTIKYKYNNKVSKDKEAIDSDSE